MQSSMLKAIVEDFGNGGTIDGDLTITGDLQVNGGGSLSFDEIIEGTSVIDVTDTEAFLVRKNSDGGDIFTVDTTNSTVEVGGHLVLPDASGSAGVLKLGGSSDIQIYHDGSHSYLDHLTGDLKIRSLAHGGDIVFHTEASDGTQYTTALTITSTGESTFAGNVNIESSSADAPIVKIKNTHAGSGSPRLYFEHDSSSPADDDEIGQIRFYADNDAGATHVFGQLKTSATDVTASGNTEDGKMEFSTLKAGTETATLTLESGDATISGTLTVNGDLADISGAHPTLKLTDSDDSNYAAIGYSDGALSIQTNAGNEGGAADTITFYTDGSGARFKLDTNSRISLSNNDSGDYNTVFGKLAGNALASGGQYNSLYGENSGDALTTADYNVALGYGALGAEVTRGTAVAVGYGALQDQTHGSDGANSENTGVGFLALSENVTGTSNTAVGFEALKGADGQSNSNNTAIGAKALKVLEDGTTNIAIGARSLTAATSATENIAIGFQSAQAFSYEEVGNISIGANAMNGMNEGDNGGDVNYNVALGLEALLGGNLDGSTTEVIGNIAIGAYALDATSTYGKTGTVAIGHQSLTACTSGQRNVAIGYQSGMTLTSADENIAIGHEALKTHLTGSKNVAIGHQVMLDTDAGTTSQSSSENVFIGYQVASGTWTDAACNHNVGIGNDVMRGALDGATQNVAVGSEALVGLTTGDGNVALGYKALEDVNTGGSNVAIGNASGISLTSGTDNIAIGTNCLYNSTDVDKAVIIGKNAGNGALDSGADGVIGIGFEALTACTSGTGNIAIGYEAGKAITTGEYSTVIGYQALKTATVTAGQDEHTAVGYQALKDCNGDRNTAVGAGAMSGVDNSDNCVAVGAYALQSGGTSDDGIDGTVAIGDSSLNSLTTGSGTTAVGKATGLYLTTGDYNTAIGFEALYTEDAGGGNTAVGYRALKVCNNDTGGNTAVGKDGLVAVTSGNNNTAVGLGAGSNLETGTNNVFIGRNSQANGTGGTNQVVIGGIDTEGNGDNTVTLGNQDATGVYAGEEGGAVVYTAGVNFPDSQAASGDVNTLDDYEEGNFTVTVSGDSSGAFSAEEGEYVKIGKVVHFRIVINVSSNFAANTIAGLPFACTQNALSSLVGGIAVMTSNANDEPITASVTTGGSTLSFYSGSDATDTHLPNTTNDVYRLEGTYFAA